MNDKNTSALPVRGLLCSVYTNPLYKGCSNGGISSKVTEVTLVGPGIPEIFYASVEAPAVKLVRRNIGGEYLHVEPIEQPIGMVGPMAGGAFVYSSDSRFPSKYPLSLHDRFDTTEDYECLTN
jgi:hypothetical protein